MASSTARCAVARSTKAPEAGAPDRILRSASSLTEPGVPAERMTSVLLVHRQVLDRHARTSRPDRELSGSIQLHADLLLWLARDRGGVLPALPDGERTSHP